MSCKPMARHQRPPAPTIRSWICLILSGLAIGCSPPFRDTSLGDADAGVDASAGFDAGTSTDAGALMDAGASMDAGGGTDGGSGSHDAGMVADAGGGPWTVQFGTSGDDWAFSVGVGPSATVIVAGYTYGSLAGQPNAGLADAFIRSFDSTGKLLWTRQFGTPAPDSLTSIAVQATGEIIVAGLTEGTLPGQVSAGGKDAFIQKYDATGALLWTRQLGTSGDDDLYAVAVDAAGHVVAAGMTRAALPGQTSAGASDAFVQKFDAAGGLLWSRQFGTAGEDAAGSVALDGAGNVYVAGAVGGALPGQASAGGADPYLRKYDPTGALLWTSQFGSSATGEIATGVSVDGAGHVFVGGRAGGLIQGQGSAGAFVQERDADGSVLWTHLIGAGVNTQVRAVRSDGTGGVLVVGETDVALPGQTHAGQLDGYAQRLDGVGAVVWTRQFGSTSFDSPLAVAVDPSGHALVAGVTSGALPGQTNSGQSDGFLVRLAP
jgi:outer membrane protein assembly factor BamB